MPQKVLLPKLGQTVEEATIEKWQKSEGDAVSKGDVLLEITTDKATLEVESFYRGTLLKILAQPGQVLPVNSLIAVIGEPGEEVPADWLSKAREVSAEAAPAAETAHAETPAVAVEEIAAAAAPPGRTVASPRARRLAKEQLVPLAVLVGSGPGGRIVEADIQSYLDKVDEKKITPVARRLAHQRGINLLFVEGTGPGGKITREDVEKARPAAPAAAIAGQRIELTAMRRIIAERMAESTRTIPCYYLTMDADVTELVALRNKLNADAETKISFNDFIVLACARAMKQFSVVNSQWAGDAIIRRPEINIGFAVALEEGLIVPVVRNADNKTLLEINREAVSLLEKARNKRLVPDEYQGGSMTISNLGMFGIKSFIPIVNPGESCILGLGMIGDRAVVYRGEISVRKVMTMSLAVDHRIVDGAVGAQFLEAVKDQLESPAELAK